MTRPGPTGGPRHASETQLAAGGRPGQRSRRPTINRTPAPRPWRRRACSAATATAGRTRRCRSNRCSSGPCPFVRGRASSERPRRRGIRRRCASGRRGTRARSSSRRRPKARNRCHSRLGILPRGFRSPVGLVRYAEAEPIKSGIWTPQRGIHRVRLNS